MLPIELVPTRTDKPGAATEREHEIGRAAAFAAAAIARGVVRGSRIAQMVQLCLDAPDGINFAAVVRREGKRELSRRLGTDLTQDAAIETIFTGLLEIVDRAVELERSLAH